MITPLLERLILNGKGSFNTFVAGGSSKCVLNVPNDHFIIITSIQYSSALKSQNIGMELPEINSLTKIFNTQLKIFSRKSMNTFLFRDSINVGSTFRDPNPPNATKHFVTPVGQQKIDCYLVHENDVSFTFSLAGVLSNDLFALTDSQSIGYPPPTDYGKEGQDGALLVRLRSNIPLSLTGAKQAQGGQLNVNGSGAISKECIFPVDLNSQYTFINESFAYPIVNVNYVLIQGLPNNISST